MKRKLFLLTLIAFAISGIAWAAVTIDNPNFLSDANGWANINCIQWEWQAGGNKDAGELVIQGTAPNPCHTYQDIQLGETKIYSASTWYKCASSDITLQLGNSISDCACTTAWAQCSVTNTLSPGAVRINVAAKGVVSLDNFVLNEVAGTPVNDQHGSIVVITLSNGGAMAIEYSWTFGEIAVTAAVITLTVLVAVRFLYDVIFQLWTWRRA